MTQEYIELKPTWTGLMPTIIMALESGTPKGKALARAELMSLARQADKINEVARGQ